MTHGRRLLLPERLELARFGLFERERIGSWIMFQSWRDLLFAHWPVAIDQLRPVVPDGLQIDTYANQAWLGIIAFRLSNIHLRGLPPVPGISSFPEVNLRTYVRHHDTPGVLFLSLHCPNHLAMAVARPWFRLPYHHACVQLHQTAGAFEFEARQTHAVAFAARYTAASAEYTAAPGALDAWLTERYCYYAASKSGRLYRCDVEHPPWRLCLATADVLHNTLAEPFGIDLPGQPARIHTARRCDAHVWPLRRL